jgi:periplasmic divalent cation tolerance protein
MSEPGKAILVLTNLPDRDSAERIAQNLVEERLAACVNVLSPALSVYHWSGKVETASEIPVLIKTLGRHYDKVESLIRRLHPYELPEIVAVEISAGLQAYLGWIAAETREEAP